REASVGEDYIEVLVKMTRQVNTGQVAHNTLQYAPPGNRGRVTVRAAVVEKLRTNAATGQEKIKQYLEQEQRNGNVLEYHGYYIVNMIFVKATPAVVEQLSHRTDVKVILPNSVIWMEPPEIIGYGDIMFQNEAWGVSRVNAPFVWEQGFRGEGAVVGIIDSGVAWEHEALRTKWRGYNSAEPGSPNVDYNWYDATVHGSALPKDASGHGTHVTGTVLGSTGSNQIGVAPDARWIAARIFDDNGKSTVDKIIRAGEFMLAPTDASGQNPRADLAPDIINNSWGSKDPGDVSEWFRDMVRAWRSAQILPVFAAGNSGEYGAGGISNPANYPECLAVAAIDSDNKLAHFSSRGPGFLPGIKPEISAPGVGIRSSTPGGSYKIDSGTSMAAPHVAGVAALLLSANPGLDVDDLEQIIINTAVPLTDSVYSLSPNYGFGYGLVDALAAVNRVCGGFVTGQVLARGIDNESPVIEHVQEIETTFLEYGFPLEAAVSDNVAVNAVKAMVRTKGAAEWTELSMYLYSGDHLYGDYWGQVPWDLVDEPGLEYKIVAVDFAGLQTETDVFNVEVKFGLMPGWNEDFALEPFMWDWDGDWEWGIPEAGPVPQYGGRVMATNLEGDYSNDLYSFLEMPPLD
ncbi:MAG: S8 family serine peptidase, partial [Firmicutes bacterium]|nr:S8 family serine peptidase [Bacillota bacterium]